MLFGGSYIPISFFPVFLQFISKYSFFGVALISTQMLNSNFWYESVYLLLSQLTWLVIIWFITIWLFKFTKKHLSINGG